MTRKNARGLSRDLDEERRLLEVYRKAEASYALAVSEMNEYYDAIVRELVARNRLHELSRLWDDLPDSLTRALIIDRLLETGKCRAEYSSGTEEFVRRKFGLRDSKRRKIAR